MRNHLAGSLGAVLLAMALGGAATTAAAPEHKPAREILVPFDDLQVILPGATDRVMLTRDAYNALLAQAQAEDKRRPPASALLTGAVYRITVEEERARLDGELTVHVLEPGVHRVRLPLSGVGVVAARLVGPAGGEPVDAAIAAEANGGTVLFVHGVGEHHLTLSLVAPIQTTAARQSLNCRLPTPPATRLRMTVPGDVELKSGAAVASRIFAASAGVTRFELVPRPGPISLVMSLNSRRKRKDRVVVARGVAVAELTQSYERLHATFSLDVLHRAVKSFRFTVPPAFDVTAVQCPRLARWAVADRGGGRELTVELREETTETVVLVVSALRLGAPPADWRLSEIAPVEVAARVSVVGLLLEDRLQPVDLRAAGLIALDVQVLRQALPRTVLQAEPGRVPVRAVAAWYAPTARFSLNGRFRAPPPALRVTANLLLTLADSGAKMHAGFALLPLYEKVFAVDLQLPRQWQVTAVRDRRQGTLAFERYAKDDDLARVHIRLPRGLRPGEQQHLLVEARHTPDAWLDEWRTRALVFPSFRILGATRDVGAVALRTEDDLRVRPTTVENLTPLDENEKGNFGLADVATDLAYRYDAPGYALAVDLIRRRPRLTAESFSFFRLDRDSLHAHYELGFSIDKARTRRLRLRLPASTPRALAIRGLGGVVIKEYDARDVGEDRVWRVLLAEAAAGRVRVAVEFETKLPGAGSGDLLLPLARAEDVAYQSGLIAVEGSAELDVQVTEHPRRVDVGELVEAEYQPGKRLLGAYGYVGAPPPVRVRVARRTTYALPPVIVQRAELAALLSAQGVAQSSARFLLRSTAVFLELTLPPGALLWSATVDGRPARPQRYEGRVLLDLGGRGSRQVHDLRVVYEMAIGPLGFRRRLNLSAPQLFVFDNRQEKRRVPVTDLSWQVYLPTGYVVSDSTAGATPVRRPQPVLAVAEMAGGLYAATGGVHVGNGLFGCVLNNLGNTRSRAMYSLPMEGEIPAPAHAYNREADEMLAGAPRDVMGDKDVAAAEENVLLKSALEDRVKEHAKKTLAVAPQSKVRPSKRAMKPGWAVAGARSLTIDLARLGPATAFRGFGEEAHLALTITDNRRHRTLAWAFGLGVFVIGLALTGRRRREKVRGLCLLLAVTTAVPAVPALVSWAPVVNGVFYGACVLVLYYLAVAMLQRLGRGRAARAVAVTSAVVVACLSASPARAFGDVVSAGDAGDAPYVIRVEPPGKVALAPPEALIVPYDADGLPGPPAGTDRLLLSRERYTQLYERAHRPRDIERPAPVPCTMAGAAYRATLAGDQDVLFSGQLAFDVFTDAHVAVPLPLQGGVLVTATLDGAPAPLGTGPALPPRQRAAQQDADALPASPLRLRMRGRGRHVLDVQVRLRLTRRGGWRMLGGRLPSAAATRLELTVPTARTEVRLTGVQDRRAYETTEPGQIIVTALSAAGALGIQWRPRVNEGQVDQTLTAVSAARFDVQEHRLQLDWDVTLNFRRGEREFFSLALPDGYLVARVAGANVRGWDVQSGADGRTLQVGLLRRARETVAFSVALWRPAAAAAAGGEAHVAVPAVVVDGAIRHTGRITIRRSPLLDVRTVRTGGVRRIALTQVRPPSASSAVTAVSPLGLRPYQAYNFAEAPFVIDLALKPLAPEVAGSSQSLLRLGDRDRRLETRLLLFARNRPLYRIVAELPAALVVDGGVTAPGNPEWSVVAGDGLQVLTVYFRRGVSGEIPVVVRGRLGASGQPVRDFSLPRVWIRGVERQHADLVVQVDPAFAVRARELQNVKRLLLDQATPWLRTEQRPLARLVLRGVRSDYGCRLQLRPRRADVSCTTVSNARVTDRAVETTILLNFAVRQAGVRRVVFRLPAALAAAEIKVPLLRQKTVEAVADTGEVRVTLDLQDDVMNELRVLVTHDVAVADGESSVPVPVVETGRTDRRYLAIESAGRDEVVVSRKVGLELLSPQQKEWHTVAAVLKGGASQAFLVSPGAAAPVLQFRREIRRQVETAGAAIGLARTLVLLDAGGAYRARQIYHVDNRTEQFLDVTLPPGAVLWTARVAGELVKPVLPERDVIRRVLIPLVKTAAGELDYQVVLKYGGVMAAPNLWRRAAMPLAHARNINVELSQVELWLPTTRRWFWFDGSMRRVREAGEFAAGILNYQNKQTQRLLEVLADDNVFAQARARANLQQQTASISSLQQQFANRTDNDELKRQLADTSVLVTNATAQLRHAAVATAMATNEVYNRDSMNDQYDKQGNSSARSRVLQLANNWGVQAGANDIAVGDEAARRFNDAWLAQNSLQTVVEADDRVSADASMPAQRVAPINGPVGIGDARLIAGYAAPAPLTQPRAVQLDAGQVDAVGAVGGQRGAGKGKTARVAGAKRPRYRQSRRKGQQELALAYGRKLEQHEKREMSAGGSYKAASHAPRLGGLTGGRASAARTAPAARPTGAAGLVSLDVQLPSFDPSRWRRLQFRTPRGDVRITARTVAERSIAAGQRLGLVAAAVLALFVCSRLSMGHPFGDRLRDHDPTLLLIVAGLLSVLFGVFPMLGVLAFVGGLGWKIARGVRRIWARVVG